MSCAKLRTYERAPETCNSGLSRFQLEDSRTTGVRCLLCENGDLSRSGTHTALSCAQERLLGLRRYGATAVLCQVCDLFSRVHNFVFMTAG